MGQSGYFMLLDFLKKSNIFTMKQIHEIGDMYKAADQAQRVVMVMKIYDYINQVKLEEKQKVRVLCSQD